MLEHEPQIQLDEDQQSIIDYCVDPQSGNAVLTGGAGVGKSAILKALQKILPPRTTVFLAPTGRAAVNLGPQAQTLHQYFNLDTHLLPTDYVPSKIEDHQVEAIKSLTHLIIDEVSMMRSDCFNSIEHILRHVKNTNERWGGVKLILVGDYLQLAPVVKEYSEKFYLEQHHGGVYAFHTEAWGHANFRYFELNKCYRQSEAEFIFHLNILRCPPDRKSLQRTIKWFNDNIVIRSHITDESFNVCPRRSDVSMINQRLYNQLDTEEVEFIARVNNFTSDEYPTSRHLRLKQFCPVRIIKNCEGTSVFSSYVNGDCGRLDCQEGDYLGITLNCGRSVTVTREDWFKYKYQELPYGDANTLSRTVVGTFNQIPLAINYAGTVHAAQGSSMDRVHLHLDSQFFAAGQLYVALSRCRTLSGLSMSRKLTIKDAHTDRSAIQFYRNMRAEINSPSTTTHRIPF